MVRTAAEVVEHFVDGLDLLDNAIVRSIRNVNQQVGVDRLFERSAEAGDEMMRQIANESHSIAQQRRVPVIEFPSPGFGRERGE